MLLSRPQPDVEILDKKTLKVFGCKKIFNRSATPNFKYSLFGKRKVIAPQCNRFSTLDDLKLFIKTNDYIYFSIYLLNNNTNCVVRYFDIKPSWLIFLINKIFVWN